jgi:hypothetical protein
MIKPCTLLFSFILATSNTAFAQVYQSTDADGNIVFSDTPTPGSQEIQIPETNLSDAVKAPEPILKPEPEPEVIVEEVPDYLTGEISGKKRDDNSDNNKRRRRPKRSPH